MLILQEAESDVVEFYERFIPDPAQPALDIRNGGIRHHQGTGNPEQSRALDGLDVAPAPFLLQEFIARSRRSRVRRSGLAFFLGAFLDALQLIAPVLPEPAGPFMERPDGQVEDVPRKGAAFSNAGSGVFFGGKKRVPMLKLGRMDGEVERPLVHGKKWNSLKYPSTEAIKIAVDSHQVDLLIGLSRRLTPPFYMLYVLLVSRCGHEPGRYQSEPFFGHAEAEIFLKKYRDYFENDGRHNIWLAEIEGNGLLVYDHHNFIYGYGDIGSFVTIVSEMGFVKGDFHIDAPHVHHYNGGFDHDENDILSHHEWKHFPLQEQDEETAG